MRRQVIERLERSTVCEYGLEDDISTINGENSFLACDLGIRYENSFSACDLGIRYPIFQAAIRREHLHMRLKVSDFITRLLHAVTRCYTVLIFFPGDGCPQKRILQDKYIPLQATSLCTEKC